MAKLKEESKKENKEVEKEITQVTKSEFDPEIPEQKQRWLR